MTYGHLVLILIGLVALIALWRIVDPPSDFRREYPRPGLDTGQSAPLLDHRRDYSAIKADVDEQVGGLVTGADATFERECRLADKSRAVAEQAVRDNPEKAQAYLDALRVEYKNHAWHSDQAHALRAVIVELSAAIEKRRQI
jgi:hypothetical protein